MADLVFDMFKEYVGDGTIDLDDDTLNCILMADTYTPDSTDSVYADVSANEVANGSGYTTGGVALSSVTWGNAAGVTTLDAADPSWATATFTARYAIILDDTPTSPADPLICLLDFGSNKTGQGGNFAITINASGLMTST